MEYKSFRNLLVAFLFSAICLFGGYYFGRRGFEVKKTPNSFIPSVVTGKKDYLEENGKTVDFKRYWQVWDLLNQKYLEKPLDFEKMLYGSISGLAKSLGDPYTTFLTPEENKSMEEALNGQYEGIGAELGKDDNDNIIVVSPLEGSPAKAAGIKPKDVILKIGNDSTFGLSLSEAVTKIRGPAGSEVTLTISRKVTVDLKESLKEMEIKIRRDKIVVKSVTWEDKGDGVALLKVSSFGENTTKDWDSSVLEILRVMPNLKAIVVDVRNNPGGYLNGAVYLSSEFIDKGAVAYQEFGDGSQQALNISNKGRLTKYPVVVLINEGSASASEILAGALKDRNKAQLVGQKSFGKGTVQDSQDFEDGSAIHITIAKWLTPNKIWVHKVGLTPDVIVFEDDATEQDEQLEKAVEVAKDSK